MISLHPVSTRTATLLPYATVFRSLLKAEYVRARGQNEVSLAGFRLLVAEIGVGARAHQGAGIASIRINRIDDAIGYLSAATKADGSLWRAWSALGVAHDLKRN